MDKRGGEYSNQPHHFLGENTKTHITKFQSHFGKLDKPNQKQEKCRENKTVIESFLFVHASVELFKKQVFKTQNYKKGLNLSPWTKNIVSF